MIKEVLISLLLWVDPTMKVVPAIPAVQVVCPSIESPEEVERADRAHAKNMEDLGKRQPGVVVDPYGVLSPRQREDLEHGARRTGDR
jgi:hypothetical protein